MTFRLAKRDRGIALIIVMIIVMIVLWVHLRGQVTVAVVGHGRVAGLSSLGSSILGR